MGNVRFWDQTQSVVDSQRGRQQALGIPPAAASGTTTGVLGQTYANNPWDIVFIKDLACPGKCEVSRGGYKLMFDPKKSRGSNGNAPVIQGYDPGPIGIKVTIWTADQWSEFQKFLQQILPPPEKGKREAMNVVHPGLALLGITQMIVTECEVPKTGSIVGTREIHIIGHEWRPTTSKKKSAVAVPLAAVQFDPRLTPSIPPSKQQKGVDYTPSNARQESPGKDKSFTAPRKP